MNPTWVTVSNALNGMLKALVEVHSLQLEEVQWTFGLCQWKTGTVGGGCQILGVLGDVRMECHVFGNKDTLCCDLMLMFLEILRLVEFITMAAVLFLRKQVCQQHACTESWQQPSIVDTQQASIGSVSQLGEGCLQQEALPMHFWVTGDLFWPGCAVLTSRFEIVVESRV